MSAIYRIEVEHHPENQVLTWVCRIRNIAEDQIVHTLGNGDEAIAVSLAYDWIVRSVQARESYALYADEHGRPVQS